MLFIATSATVTYPSDLEGKNWFGIAGLPDSILRCDWVVRARLDYREGGERKGEGGGGGKRLRRRTRDGREKEGAGIDRGKEAAQCSIARL